MERTITVAVPFGAGSISPVINGFPGRGRYGANYLKRIEGRLELVTLHAAASAALPGRRMIEAIQSLNVTPAGGGVPLVNNLNGQSIRWVQWPLTLRAPEDPADVPANADDTITSIIKFTLNFADPRARQHKDGAVPMQFVADGDTSVNFKGASATLGAGITIEDDTVLYLTYVYEERMDCDVGERVTYEMVGLTTIQNMPFPPGMLTDLLLTPKDGSDAKALDENSFTAITFDEDGDRIHSNTKPNVIIDAYDKTMVTDQASDLPQMDAAQTEFIPLVWPGRDNSDMGDRAIASGGFNLLATAGSGDPEPRNLQFVARRVVKADITDSAKQISSADPNITEGEAALGLQVAAKLPDDQAANVIRPATNSKVPLHGDKGAIYGDFMRRQVAPAALKAVAREAVKGK